MPQQSTSGEPSCSLDDQIDSEDEIRLDLQGRKHIEKGDQKSAFYSLPGDCGTAYCFSMPGLESADALRASLSKHLPANLITDEYGYVESIEKISNNHLPNLQAKLWRELPMDHNARVLSLSFPDLFTPGLQLAQLLPVLSSFSSDEVQQAHDVDTIAELLTRRHVFILREGTKIKCASLTCCSKSDHQHSTVNIIAIEPLLDWATITLAQDTPNDRGEVTVYRRDGKKLKDSLWTQAVRKFAPENPLAYCVDCLKRLVDIRFKAWEILDLSRDTYDDSTQSVQLSDQAHKSTNAPNNGTVVHTEARLQPGFARQAEHSPEEVANESDLNGHSQPTHPNLDGTSPSPPSKNTIPVRKYQKILPKPQINDPLAQNWSKVDNNTSNYTWIPYTQPGLSLPPPRSAAPTRPTAPTNRTSSFAYPVPTISSTVPSAQFSFPQHPNPTASAASTQAEQPRYRAILPYIPEQHAYSGNASNVSYAPAMDPLSAFTKLGQGTKRKFGRTIDSNAASGTNLASAAVEDAEKKMEKLVIKSSVLSAAELCVPPSPAEAIAKEEEKKIATTATKSTRKATVPAAPKTGPDLDNINFYTAPPPKEQSLHKHETPVLTTTMTTTDTTKKKPASATPSSSSTILPFPPSFAKTTPIDPSTVPSDFTPESYLLNRRTAPTPTQRICTCHAPSAAGSVRIAQCVNISCPVQWYHHACLGKIEKLKAHHGTLRCQMCLNATFFAEQDKKNGWREEDAVRSYTALPWTFKEIRDAYPGVGGVPGIKHPYGIGAEVVVKDEGVRVRMADGTEEVRRVGDGDGRRKPELGALRFMGYEESRPEAVVNAWIGVWKGKPVVRVEDEEAWDADEEDFDEEEECYEEEYYEDEEEVEEVEEEEVLEEEKGDEEPTQKRARFS